MSSQSLSELYPHAFVTGASSGLGRAFAEMLLAEGVRVWGTSRDAARLTELAVRHPTAFTPVVLDLAAPAAGITAFRRAAKSAGGTFELLVNNAGYGVFGPFADLEFSAWQAQFDTMLTATVGLCHEALRIMLPHGRGCIVNVSSLATEFPIPYMSGYNVAKAGLSALSESLVVETAGTGISVIDFRLGDFRTDFNNAMQSASSASTVVSPAATRAWAALERNLRQSPPPTEAARELRRALRKRRVGIVRAGGIFQAQVAPLLSRFVPRWVIRRVAARYFGI